MKDNLKALIERAKKIKMTPQQVTEQRRSFAFGNTHIENDRITRQMIADLDEKISMEQAPIRE